MPNPETTAGITFDQWCDQLRGIGSIEPWRYGPDPIASCGAECWREYYDDGYSPRDAWWEDGTYD